MAGKITLSDEELNSLPDYTFSDQEFESLPDAPQQDSSWSDSLGSIIDKYAGAPLVGFSAGMDTLGEGVLGIGREIQDAGIAAYNALPFDDISNSPTWLDQLQTGARRLSQKDRERANELASDSSIAKFEASMGEGLGGFLPMTAMTSGVAPLIALLSSLSGGRKYGEVKDVTNDPYSASGAALVREGLAVPENMIGMIGGPGNGSLMSRTLINSLGGGASGLIGGPAELYSTSVGTGEDFSPAQYERAAKDAAIQGLITGATLPAAMEIGNRAMGRKVSRTGPLDEDTLAAIEKAYPPRQLALPAPEILPGDGFTYRNMRPGEAAPEFVGQTDLKYGPGEIPPITLESPEAFIPGIPQGRLPIGAQAVGDEATNGTAIADVAAPVRAQEIAAPPQAVQAEQASKVVPRQEVAPQIEPKHPSSYLENIADVRLPVSSLKLSKDVPQWKSGANEEGVVSPLKGGFDERGLAPIIVWQRLNGDMEIVTGRHRWAHAKATGKETIKSQIVREADGFTAKEAAVLDAELNIRDGDGEVTDYANYFRSSGYSEAEATARGLLSDNKGILGFSIGTKATPDLYALYQDGRISERKAARIADTAPGNDSIQQVGIKTALSGAPADVVVNQMRVLQHDYANTPQSEQLSMFGSDNRAIKLAEEQARVATQMQRGIAEQIRAVQGAAKRPDLAAKLGVNVKDPNGVINKITELKSQEQRLDRWFNDPEFSPQIRQKAAENLGSKSAQKPPPDPSGAINKVLNNPEAGGINVQDILQAGKDIGKWADETFRGVKLDDNSTDYERFLAGAIGNREKQMPGLSLLRNNLTQARTIDQKFKLRDNLGTGFGFHDALAARPEKTNAAAFDMMETGRDLFSLKDPKEFNGVSAMLLSKYDDAARNGQSLPPPTTQMIDTLPVTPETKAALKASIALKNKAIQIIKESKEARLPGIADPGKRQQEANYINSLVTELQNKPFYAPRRRSGGFSVTGEDAQGIKYFYRFDDAKEAKARAETLRSSGVKNVVARRAKIDEPTAYGTYDAESTASNNFENNHLSEARMDRGWDSDLQASWLDYVKSLSSYAGVQTSRGMVDQINNVLPGGSASRNFINKKYNEAIRSPSGVVQKLLQFQNIKQLAAVPSTALINASQTVTTTTPKIFGELVKANAGTATAKTAEIMGKASADAFASLFDRTAKTMDPQQYAHLQQGIKEGWIDSQGLNDLYQTEKRFNGRAGIMDAAMFMHSSAEQANRRIAHAAGWRTGKELGLSGEALKQYAKDIVYDTQFDLTSANRSSVMNSNMGRVAFQFMNYPVNYLRFLRNHAALNSGSLGTLSSSLMIQGAIGGLMALPFAKTLERAYNLVYGDDVKDKAMKALGDDNWADAIMYGLPNLAGVDLSGQAGTGDFIGNVDRDKKVMVGQLMLGPTFSTVKDFTKAGEAFSKGANRLGLEYLAPRSVRGLSKALRGASEGKITDQDGFTVLDNPSTSEILTLAGGGTPARLAQNNRMKSAKFELDRSVEDKPSQWNTRLAKALASGDRKEFEQIKAEAVEWNTKAKPEQIYEPNWPTIKKKAAEIASGAPFSVANTPKRSRKALEQILQRYDRP